MSPRAQLDRITARARRDALALVAATLKAATPPGWRIVLAVGWGLTVFDETGSRVHEDGPRYHGDSPHKWSGKLKRAVALAEHFEDTYRFGNEQIIPKGGR